MKIDDIILAVKEVIRSDQIALNRAEWLRHILSGKWQDEVEKVVNGLMNKTSFYGHLETQISVFYRIYERIMKDNPWVKEKEISKIFTNSISLGAAHKFFGRKLHRMFFELCQQELKK